MGIRIKIPYASLKVSLNAEQQELLHSIESDLRKINIMFDTGFDNNGIRYWEFDFSLKGANAICTNCGYDANNDRDKKNKT